jgi:glycosyltransferase involved in cell wall biosynthesis
MVKVSLYIPCYNSEKTIKECLDSVIKQSYKIDEILVIDDGSEDRTVAIAMRYPVKVISHKKNIGLAASRNTALRQVKNEFIAALDADCVADSRWLKLLMDCFVDDDIAGVGGMLIERYTLGSADAWRSVHMAQLWGNELLENPPFLYGSNNVFRKEAIEKVGLYNEQCRNNYEDVEISTRLYSRGFRLIYNPVAYIEHLKKDTISSALSSYRSWLHYKHISSSQLNQPFSRLALAIGKAVEYTEISEFFFREDLRQKDYKLLPIDFLLMFYCIWNDSKEGVRNIFHIGIGR